MWRKNKFSLYKPIWKKIAKLAKILWKRPEILTKIKKQIWFHETANEGKN